MRVIPANLITPSDADLAPADLGHEPDVVEIMDAVTTSTDPISDSDLLEMIWALASQGLEHAYAVHHDFDNVGTPDEEKARTQGVKDSYRKVLAIMRHHSRFRNNPDHHNEAG